MLTKAVVVSVPREESGGKTGGDTVLAQGVVANGNLTPGYLLNRSLT